MWLVYDKVILSLCLHQACRISTLQHKSNSYKSVVYWRCGLNWHDFWIWWLQTRLDKIIKDLQLTLYFNTNDMTRLPVESTTFDNGSTYSWSERCIWQCPPAHYSIWALKYSVRLTHSQILRDPSSPQSSLLRAEIRNLWRPVKRRNRTTSSSSKDRGERKYQIRDLGCTLWIYCPSTCWEASQHTYLM